MKSSDQTNPTTDRENVVEQQPSTGDAEIAPLVPKEKLSLRSLIRGDLGFLPVLITLAIITLYFQLTTNGVFLQARNLSNLTQQIVVISILSTAAVLVLLLGEIDLSLAAVAQACAAVMATLSVYQNWNAASAIGAALLTGAVIGLVNGFFVAVLRVPSFIVTL
ncbi:ABC transporter permease subunit, partial [Phormidesmis sp. 146-33]